MQKITPFLWFDQNAEEAIQFYTSVFKSSKIVSTQRNPDGKLFTATVEIEGQRLMVLNGGPYFKLTEAFSLFVDCETQEEVGALWETMSEGGAKGQCGWLKDRFGLSWQIIPRTLMELLSDKDPARSKRVMDAMLKMTKIDIAALKEAHAAEG
jgi:predicted 3-demethylubiquinone-9 3-methyltransferase (glyoxalase superfamily)